MDFQELISDFATRHGIGNLVAEDNAAALDVDGIVVTLVGAGDVLSLSAEIGEPPSEGRAEFAELLLEASLQSDAFFAKAPEKGAYILVRRLLAETWCKLLSDFRPVAKAAAEHVEEAPNFGTHGFMQV